MTSASAIFISLIEAIMCLLQIVPYIYAVVKKEWEYSQDEVTLISEKIESVALAILELCLSEGISK